MMDKMKTLLLHVPKFNNYYKPIGDFIWLTYMPVGLLAIADYAAKNRADVEVIHLGVEWALDRKFDVADLIRNNPEVRAVGLTLHWHHQSYDTIEAARRIKEIRDDIFVFLGGDTSSFFHDEIIAGYPEIDGVIRGHGERPLISLIGALEGNEGLSSVPNLTWRENGLVRENRFEYVADEKILTSLNYTNFSLLRHADTYVRYLGIPFFFAKGFGLERNFKMFTLGSPMFPVPIGRGCPFNCTWCAGSHIPQQQYINRLKGFIYRSHQSIIESVVAASDMGYRLMHSCMDPEPRTQDFFIDLWQMMRKEKIKTDWVFECNGLASDRFVGEFKKTFPGRDSVIVLSPETGSETLRLRHKGPGFTNRALFEKMDLIDGLGITSELFFTYGLPGENRAILEDTIALQRQLAKKYRHMRAIRTLAVEMEPGSPWHLDPDRFGIVTDRKNFADFYHAHSDQDQGAYTSFGYYIPGYFEKPLDPKNPFHDFAQRMQRLKCSKFCFIHPNPRKAGRPWQGRMFCAVASRLIRLKPRDLSRPY
jgi:radical SAM superfamily enzyme YgiQ (UPF0313 family)